MTAHTDNQTPEVKGIVENVYKYLYRRKEYINGLNVFPVPDGDTGLNMTLTIQGALANMPDYDGRIISNGEYLKDLAEQMLMNSRGCSGVILALYCHGISEVIVNGDFSPANIHKALENGYQKAYHGIDNPKEGTILTLMYEFKEKFGELMAEEDDFAAIIRKCIPHLKSVLDKTPDMLPVLKQAGVVDSGAAGFLIILEGFEKEINVKQSASGEVSASTVLNAIRKIRKLIQNSALNKQNNHRGGLHINGGLEKINNIKLRNIINDLQRHSGNMLNKNKNKSLKETWLNDLKEMESTWDPPIQYRYCTEFVLKTDKISSQDEIRQLVEGYGDSLIVLNSSDLYKVHIHTNKPEAVFNDVAKYGELVFKKVDDMKKQHKNFISHDAIEYERESSIFCIVSGQGFKKILEELGADHVFCYGKKKPSVEQLVKAINQLKAKNVIAAPDDQDILMSLKYAATLCKSNVQIVESKSVISLISMLMAASNDMNVNNMSFISKLNDIRFCGISRAVRETRAEDGTLVKKGDFFTIYDHQIICSGKHIKEVAVESIKKLAQNENLITLYKGIPAKKDHSLLPELRSLFPDKEFEEYYGGQYQYYYYITFE